MDNNVTCGNCYVAYFDILGFKNMLLNFKEQHGGHLDVFVKVYYHDVIKAIEKIGRYNPDYVTITWFSDSFILFSHDDTLKSFVAIDQAARHFFWKIVCMGIPLQGALGFGEFYGDQNRSIYLGQALIDAYNYAETQDWIGFIITPSTVKELDDSKNVPSRVNYFEHDVIFKQNNIKRLYAYKPQSGMRDPMLRKVREMQSQARHKHPDKYDKKYKQKYERTIAFLDS